MTAERHLHMSGGLLHGRLLPVPPLLAQMMVEHPAGPILVDLSDGAPGGRPVVYTAYPALNRSGQIDANAEWHAYDGDHTDEHWRPFTMIHAQVSVTAAGHEIPGVLRAMVGVLSDTFFTDIRAAIGDLPETQVTAVRSKRSGLAVRGDNEWTYHEFALLHLPYVTIATP